MVGNTNKALPTVGVLALQGDTALHVEALTALGAKPVYVRHPSQLKMIDGIVFPGGESSALLRLLEPLGMVEALQAFARDGGSIFGTCAGAILLANHVIHPEQHSLRLIDMTVERNGWGRQIDSGDYPVAVRLPGNKAFTAPMTFIRAPRISQTGPHAHVLATRNDEPVLVMQEQLLAATFHPELSRDEQIYRYWLMNLVPGGSVKTAAAKANKS